MTKTDYPEFLAVLRGIAEAKHATITEDGIAEWWTACEKLPLPAFHEAIRSAAAESQWMPDPWEVLRNAPRESSTGTIMRQMTEGQESPQALQDWRRASVHLMRRIGKIGWEKAIAEELAEPTIDDPDWCATIVAWASGQEAPTPTDPWGENSPGGDPTRQPTYICPTCRDRGFTVRIAGPEDRHPGCAFSASCDCQRGDDHEAAQKRWHEKLWKHKAVDSRPPS